MRKWFLIAFLPLLAFLPGPESNRWIRINQLGYTTSGSKVAVWCSKDPVELSRWQLIDARTRKIATSGMAGSAYGAYGPFASTYRLDFSRFKKPGRYYLQAGGARSPEFSISDTVYNGTADFCLRYMRQQRTGFNPFLKDSCHTHDGYVLYGQQAGIADSSYVDVVGGWHDASDYLQYSTTSANATYHLLMAYRDFPGVFTDQHLANGLAGGNGQPDVLDEARWGLQWLMKMNPAPGQLFNQIGDDRDHINMRIPGQDTQYGRGMQRPVYFVSGEPQQRGKFMNNTTGTSSTAAKFSSVYALAHTLYETDPLFRGTDQSKGYYDRAFSAYLFAQRKPGVTQTASVKSPYIYAEDNWVDDMELAAAAIHQMLRTTSGTGDNRYYLNDALEYAAREPVTPWLGRDTAKHYQWYPFINLGHYELLKLLDGQHAAAGRSDVKNTEDKQATVLAYYRKGIEAVWEKAKGNAFLRGVPFIWCSNNLTVAFAMQCRWYRQLTGDTSFLQLEQACIDWLFGCNPWGTSMVYGLPSWGDTPVDPHSAFTHLGKYPIDGGLVDGPVYTSIYKNLIGIQLNDPDEYAAFQSDLAVYHDDYGDYSTNEPTMDGTASLIYLLASMQAEASGKQGSTLSALPYLKEKGAIVRGDTTQKQLAIVFTGDEFGDGLMSVKKTLKQYQARASFFLTGRFYRNPRWIPGIQALQKDGHYLGAHSNDHLLYCDWKNRDSLLVNRRQFDNDLYANYAAMSELGIDRQSASLFLPPYEWYNDSIAAWTHEQGLQLINYTPGTRSHADYTWPGLTGYRSNEEIYQSIVQYENSRPAGLNGFILLLHVGVDARRQPPFYRELPRLLNYLKARGYRLKRVDELLTTTSRT
ncbi:MAG: glycoside hydrolase family 9 protein [Chitinophagaceae bacterium]|nr:glycoside hydrolase family 9 protein [Chitinophagaceae bacterium]